VTMTIIMTAMTTTTVTTATTTIATKNGSSEHDRPSRAVFAGPVIFLVCLNSRSQPRLP
jgi:hypothetical protein